MWWARKVTGKVKERRRKWRKRRGRKGTGLLPFVLFCEMFAQEMERKERKGGKG